MPTNMANMLKHLAASSVSFVIAFCPSHESWLTFRAIPWNWHSTILHSLFHFVLLYVHDTIELFFLDERQFGLCMRNPIDSHLHHFILLMWYRLDCHFVPCTGTWEENNVYSSSSLEDFQAASLFILSPKILIYLMVSYSLEKRPQFSLLWL